MKKWIKLTLLSLIIFAFSFVGGKLDNLTFDTVNAFSDKQSEIITTATLPSEYDLSDYIYIGVENQNPYGICYAYASLTSLETYLALNYGEYYDFSELHFALSLYKQDSYYASVDEALNDGGNFTHFALYAQKDKSIVLENEMPMSKYLKLASYKRTSAMESDYTAINENFYQLVKVNNTKTYPQIAGNKSQYSSTELLSFRNSVKNHIMQYGSLTAGIHSDDTFSNSTVNYCITDDKLVANPNAIISNINHLISIVGWDDNYDANGAWANKGAYLCLNSWGTSFGNNGYFYVSYDDYFIESTIQGVVDATLSTTNNKISTIQNHQDSTFIIPYILNCDLYSANIFDTTAYVGQNISYIDTFVKGGATKFYVKFYDNYNTAFANLNSISIMNLVSSTKVDEYSLYNKYQLSTPLNISGKYMLIVTEVKDATRANSLSSYSTSLEPTYIHTAGLGYFSSSNTWVNEVSDGDMDATIPLILHTNNTYVKPSQFSSNVTSIISLKYIKNNAIFYNKSITMNLENASISAEDLSNITITKLYNDSFTDVSSNFDFNLNSTTLTITMINELSGSFNAGNYLVAIPCGDTVIYRVIEVQNVVSYSITYHLNGGTATNPKAYTNKHTSLTLNSPTHPGYAFVGWYTDSDLTVSFDSDNLPYTNLVLYAKYDFAAPTISSKTKNINVVYSGQEILLTVNATHHLLNEFNTLSYAWYYRQNLSDDFAVIDGATSNTLRVKNVVDSGYYCCQVAITIADTSLVNEPVTKILLPSTTNQISVNIKPLIYDMSNAKWNYSQAFSYDTMLHKVEVINLPDGVTINYTNNQSSQIGTYTAHAELVYDDMDGNAVANPIEDLTWQIRKAKITITIDDIVSKQPLSAETLNFMYSCTIESEYLPENVVTIQDKLNYLELVYQLQDTEHDNIKTITAITKDFDIHDITIINGQYRVVVHKLTYNNIISTNDNGFVADCQFTANTLDVTNDISKLLNKQNLTLIDGYNINYSYLDGQAKIYIPLNRSVLFNNLQVYMLKDNKLIKVDNVKVTADGLSFTTSQQNGTYIIATDDNSHNSNTEMLILIGIIAIYIGLCAYIIISTIKHKNSY